MPHGTVEQMPPWESKIFANTTRDWSIYVPAQYKAEQPAALMVFQDGEGMQDVKGRWRVPVVFDNLIARGDMPPTIAVFINPGHDEGQAAKARAGTPTAASSTTASATATPASCSKRSFPRCEKKYASRTTRRCAPSAAPARAAICAFTAAWERPDVFRKVYSSVGSFTNLRGGNVYPSLIRKTEPKPIRVYMADTSGDVDNPFGSWPWANQQMASALKYMGYDVRFDWAEGYAHNADFGGSKFPDAMKWLWRKEKPRRVLDTKGDLGGDLTLLNLLIPRRSRGKWSPTSLGFADAPCADDGRQRLLLRHEGPGRLSHRRDAMATRKEICKEVGQRHGFGPDGSAVRLPGREEPRDLASTRRPAR